MNVVDDVASTTAMYWVWSPHNLRP